MDARRTIADVRLGIALTGAHRPDRPRAAVDDLVAVAVAAEEAGLDSVWLGDHLGSGSHPWFSNLLVLGQVAARTERIRLGAVVIGALREPFALAHDVATLDVVSGGRVALCVVGGWHEEEFRLLGVPFAERTDRAAETLAAVDAIWSGTAFSGAHLSVGAAGAAGTTPPTQAVPRWFGGSGPRSAGIAGRAGVGYLQSSHVDVGRARERSETFRSAGRSLPQAGPVGVIRQVHVAGRDDTAWQQAGPALGEYFDAYRSSGLGAREGYAGAPAADEGLRCVVGAPDTVAAQLGAVADAAGAALLVCRVGWPGMPRAQAVEAVRLLGTDVAPALGRAA